jgi:5'-deoxynucleotidase YfbR-like HD superfamily hydrolase
MEDINNYEGKIETFSGVLFDLINPQSTDVKLVDIAHALAATNRFGGHCRLPYSVAQHSVLCSQNCEFPEWALMHDASEAYVGDVTRPLKQMLGAAYKEIEMNILYAIGIHFKLPPHEEHEEAVKDVDNRLLITEKRDLMPDKEWRYLQDVEPLPDKIEPWSFSTAKTMFITRALNLFPHLIPEYNGYLNQLSASLGINTIPFPVDEPFPVGK